MLFFFFNDTATTEIYTLSLHDALPISSRVRFGYEHGLYWFANPSVRLGVEGFGNFGPIGSFPTTNLQTHSWGPAVKFKFGNVGWDLGMQFGWTDASDHVVFKSIVDFEF